MDSQLLNSAEAHLNRSIIGTAVSWAATFFSFIEHHTALLSLALAAVASIYTIRASRASKALSDAQRKKLEDTKT